MAKRISMRELARLAGVSHMTVSLALRNHPSISAATKQKVLAIADQHDYRPDPSISRVMSKLRFGKESGHVLAFVTQFENRNWMSHHVHGAIYRGALAAAEQYGYRLDVFDMGPLGLRPRRLQQILLTRSIQGIIVTSNPNHVSHLRLNIKPFSVIELGTGLLRPIINRVTTNAIHNFNLAIRALRHAGAHRIGLVMDALVDMRCERLWSAGLAVFHGSIPARERVPPLLQRGLDFPHFKKWFNQHKPDAIACIESRILQWLSDLKVRCPDGVQVVALDRKESDTDLAGVSQNHLHVGRMATELLIGQMHLNETGSPKIPRTTLIDGTWVDGPSCFYSLPRQKRKPSANPASQAGTAHAS